MTERPHPAPQAADSVDDSAHDSDTSETSPDQTPHMQAEPYADKLSGADDKNRERTAVVIIHGQGEQRPMESVRELARTVWSSDPELSQALSAINPDGEDLRLWSTPDAASNTFELRRLSTESVQDGERNLDGSATARRFDFYEFYWAHMMQGTRLVHVVLWFTELLGRGRAQTPAILLPVREAIVRFAELSALFAAAFAVMTSALVLRAPGSSSGLGQTLDVLQAAWRTHGWRGLAGAPQELGLFLTVSLMVTTALVVLPVSAAWFVMGRRPSEGAPETQEARTSEALAQQAERQARSVVGARWAALVVLGFLILVVTVISPTFEWRDVIAVAGVLSVGVFAIAEWGRGRLSAAGFSFVVLAIMVMMASVPDGRVLAGLALSAAATIWLAWRRNYLGSTLTGGLTVLAAVATRLAVVDPALFAQVQFSAGLDWLAGLAWGYFFFFAFGFGAFIATAGATRGVRARWFALVCAVSAAGAFCIWTWGTGADAGPDASGEAIWSSLFARPDGLDGAIGVRNPVHLHFWLITVVLVGALALAAIVALLSFAFLAPVMGDSARYLRPTPDNIAQRQRIRAAGVQLLEALHDGERYDRIIVVGHSLGSIVGYDVLTHFWGRRCDRLHVSSQAESLGRVEAAARRLVFHAMEDVSRRTDALTDALRGLGARGAGRALAAEHWDGAVGDIETPLASQERRRVMCVRLDRCASALDVLAQKVSSVRAPARALAASLRTGPHAYGAAAAHAGALHAALSARRGERAAAAADAVLGVQSALAEAAAAHGVFRSRQRAYADALGAVRDVRRDAYDQPLHDADGTPVETHPWRITDFITLGSPLHFGAFLLARSHEDFAHRKIHRELPTCPPQMEREPPRGLRPPVPEFRFSYRRRDAGGLRGASAGESQGGTFGPSHGAVFGAVRWTNVHFRTESLLIGDIIGGPLWREFDYGVADIEVDWRPTGHAFAHNEYWRSALSTADLRAKSSTGELPEHLAALRSALDLARKGDRLAS